MLRIKKIGLLPRVALAIALGILCAFWMPSSLSRVFATFNELFGNFLGFAIPLIVFGLVASGIAELGTGASRLLGITTLLAYGSTLLAGFFAYFVCLWCYPPILGSEASLGSLETAGVSRLAPYFTVEMPPIADVTSALLLSFVLGLGTARGSGNTLKKGLSEFRDVIGRIIERAIVPLLPLYIFGIFLKMGAEGQVAGILSLFSENHRAHFCDASAVAAFPIRSGGHRLAPQPAETASHDAARLHDGAGDAIFGGDHSRHAGADDPQRRESRSWPDSSSRSTRRFISRAAF